MSEITPELLLNAYANGYFPMADERKSAEIGWYSPDPRGILPLNGFHVPKKLRKTVISMPFEVKTDQSFQKVMEHCSKPRAKQKGTWINPKLVELYTELNHLSFAHSVECWLEDELVGGLYGVSLGGVFFGESMFSHATDASKVALVYLVEILRQAGYQLLDTQYVNEHLLQFGVTEISRKDYLDKLSRILSASDNPSKRFSTVSGSVIASDPRGFSVMVPPLTDNLI